MKKLVFLICLTACAEDKCLTSADCRVERLHTLSAKIETIQAKFNGELQTLQAQLAGKYQPQAAPLLDEQNTIRVIICKEAKLAYPDTCVVDDATGKASEKPKTPPPSTK